MKQASCNICKSPEFAPKYEFEIKPNGEYEKFNLVRCRDCNLVYINPQPDENELEKYYQADDYYSYSEVLKEESGELSLIEKIKRCLREKIFSLYGSSKRSIVDYFLLVLLFPFKRRFGGIPQQIPGGRLLDIGCGDGLFLRELKKHGWYTAGIELDARACNRAKRYLEEVYCGKFENIDIKPASFDVIRFWHVVEHTHNPLAVMKKTHDCLKPGGRVIIGLPNINSLASRLFKQRWSGLDIPRHLYHFSPATIRRLLKQAGFEGIKVSYCSVGTGLASLKDILDGKLKNKKLTSLLCDNPLTRGLSIFMDTGLDILRLGDSLEIEARRSE